MGHGKDLAMKKQMSLSVEFKRQIIEELLSGESSPRQLSRRYNTSSSVPCCTWLELVEEDRML